MSEHLLTRDDVELIQDFMLTKVTLLLGKTATMDEWQAEIKEEEGRSQGRWVGRNAFLFDYTLGRFLAAISEVKRDSGADDELPPIGPVETFAQEFIYAIGQNDSGHAEEVWLVQNVPAGLTETPGSMSSTFSLVLRLLRVAPSVDLRAAVEELPTEFEPTQFVS